MIRIKREEVIVLQQDIETLKTNIEKVEFIEGGDTIALYEL